MATEFNFTGWEVGDFGESFCAGVINYAPSCHAVVSTNSPRSGLYHAKWVELGSGSQPINLPGGTITNTTGTVTAGNHKRFRSRVYVRCDAYAGGVTRLIGVGSESVNNAAWVHIWMDSARQLGLRNNNFPSDISFISVPFSGPHTAPLTLGVWYRLILDVDLAVSSSGTALSASMQVTEDSSTPTFDETKTLSVTLGANVDTLGLLGVASIASGNACTFFFDDLVYKGASDADAVSALTLPGETRVLPLPPTGTSVNAWTGAATDVDEYPVNTATSDYVSTAGAIGTEVAFTHASASTLGIKGIYAAKLYANTQVASGSGTLTLTLGSLSKTNPVKVICASQDTSGSSGTALIGPIFRGDMYPGAFDAMTFGAVQTVASQSSRLLNVLVEYITQTLPTSLIRGTTQVRAGSISTTEITDASIADVDISASAAISLSKLAPPAAKGDLIVSTGSAWTRKAVGTDGKALLADSTKTDGLDWGTVASSSGGGPSSGGSLIFLKEVVAANVAQVDLTGITAAYDEYIIEVLDAAPASNGALLQMRISSDGGATFDTASNYRSSVYQTNEGTFSTNLNLGATTSFTLCNAASNAAGAAVVGRATLYSPSSAVHKRTLQHFASLSTDGNYYNQIGAGRYSANGAITAVRLYFSTGNIVSGSFRLYGVAKNVLGVAGTGALVFLKELVAAGSATLDLTSVISAAYDEYVVEIIGLLPATASTSIWMLASTDNGATWLSTGYRYTLRYFGDVADSGSAGNSQNDSKFLFGGTFPTSAPGCYGTMTLQIGTGQFCAYGILVSNHTNTNRYRFDYAFWQPQTVNAVRFLFSSGNITSGSIRIYGVAKTAVSVPTDPAFTLPVDSGFSWVNQGSGSLIVTPTSLTIHGPGTGSAATNMIARVKTAPTPPYTITAYLRGTSISKSFLSCGLLWRSSSGGQIHYVRLVGQTGTSVQLFGDKFTSAVAYGSGYFSYWCGDLNWFRLKDDGTNRITQISADGQDWVTVHSVARTDFLTPDQVGFAIDTMNNATPNLDMSVTVFSWKETQP